MWKQQKISFIRSSEFPDTQSELGPAFSSKSHFIAIDITTDKSIHLKGHSVTIFKFGSYPPL